jgi:RIO kinase 1
MSTHWDDDVGDRSPQSSLSSYPDADQHGPEPVPDWVITSGNALDTELGLLKTGKEAEVFVLARRHDGRTNLLASKRYRDIRRRAFRNDVAYRADRNLGPKAHREQRAIDKGTRQGLALHAELWAAHEFATLSKLWSAGVAVPYPVQRAGTELVLEYLGDEDEGAARLVQVRVTPAERDDLLEQAVTLLRQMTAAGVVHGDLSPYNLLVWQDRLHAIDLPQAVHPNRNPNGLDLLHRDVVNVLGWFTRKGARIDAEALYVELLDDALMV